MDILPTFVRLLNSFATHVSLLNADQVIPIVHEPTIRAQLAGVLPIAASSGTEILFNMIFAMGALDIETDEQRSRGDPYYLKAHAALKRNGLDARSIPFVQGIAIMANYAQRVDRPDFGYILLGWAFRLAMILGLHSDVQRSKCTVFEREMRLRIWWGIIALDSGSSVTFGRPHAAGYYQLSSCRLPCATSDSELTPLSKDIALRQSSDVSPYTSLLAQAVLAREAANLHARILCDNPMPTPEQVQRYDQRIVSALHEMSFGLYSTASLGMRIFTWRTRDFRAMLYRPFLVKTVCQTSSDEALPIEVSTAIE